MFDKDQPHKQIKAILFDLDGTLVDTHKANFEAYRHALFLEGVVICWDDFERTIGLESKDFLPILYPGITSEQMARVAFEKSRKYRKLVHKTEINHGLKNLLIASRQYLQTGLVTTAKRENADAVLRYHGLKPYFDIVITKEDVVQNKPASECYLLALERLGLRSDEVIVFEDSETGLIAAESAGIKVIMVGSKKQ